MSARLNFEYRFGPGPDPRSRRRDPDAPLRILILGDFGGRGARAAAAGGIGGGRPVPVDVDSLDTVFGKLAPALHLSGEAFPEEGVDLAFRSLEDFGADHLFRTIPLFGAFRETRDRLMNPATFAEAAAGLTRTEAAAEAPVEKEAPESEEETLDRLLGKRPAAPEGSRDMAGRRAAAGLDRFIRDAVQPYVVPSPDPRRDDLVASVDLAIAERMRAVLHHPRFRELEGLWRCVERFIAEVETGESVRLALLDVTREELAADLPADQESLEASALRRTLVDEDASTLGGTPWGLLVGAFTFGPGAGDLSLLARLGAVASAAGGCFLGTADPALLGIRSLAEGANPAGWLPPGDDALEDYRALRRSPWAASIGLAFPRILYRHPYGRRGERTESFDFEEIDAASGHDAFPWAHPGAALAELLARSFLDRGAGMEPGDDLDIEGLPAFSYDDGGEMRLLPGAEALIGERGMHALIERGLIPLLSYRDRNAVRVGRFQSVADPPAPLAGPWAS